MLGSLFFFWRDQKVSILDSVDLKVTENLCPILSVVLW